MGSRNKRTQALLDLAEEGETPCTFAVRIMRDDDQPITIRIAAAKIAAPYMHSKPQPEPRMVTFKLPADLDAVAGMLKLHSAILKAAASGELPLDEARELSVILETQRRLVETVDLEARISKLEKEPPR